MQQYTTKEIMSITGINRLTLFRWEASGVIPKPKRDRNNYRCYSEEILQEILRLSHKNRHEIFAIVNQKGGSGKTTTVLNLGACLAELNQKVLVVDLDSQANLTFGLGYELEDKKSTYHLLTDDKTALSEIVIPTQFSNLFLAPADIGLANADFDLRQLVLGEEILGKKLAAAREDYNYILLDCPPSLGPIVSSGILAADKLIIPVPVQQFSIVGLRNLISFVSVILQRTKNKITAHILPNMIDERLQSAKAMYEELKQTFQSDIMPEIRTSSAIPDSQAHRLPVIHYKKSSRGAKDFKRLADYLLKAVKPTLA